MLIPGHILDISSYLTVEYARTNEERKYVTKEYRPTAEILAKLLNIL